MENERIEFISLPSRPMKDIIIDETVTAENLKSYIDIQISKIPADSIVRILFSKSADKQLKTFFTSSFMKSIIPPKMNFQFGSGIFNYSKKD